MHIPFLSSLFRTRDKPQNYYIGTDFRYLFGPSTSGKMVNEFTAMQTTAVYACVRILAETLAALPLQLYRYTPGGKERVYDHPLYHLLHDEPNPEMTSFIFRETLMSHLLIWGNAYAQIIRDRLGRVQGLYPLRPDKMTVCRDDRGQISICIPRRVMRIRMSNHTGRWSCRRKMYCISPALVLTAWSAIRPLPWPAMPWA